MTGGGIMISRASLRKTASGFVLAAALFATGLPAAPVGAAEAGPEIAAQSWSFSGPFGTFDRAQLQRGYKVYKQICSACHGMRQLHFRNLGQDGPNDEGEMFTRPGRPADAFPSPFPNKQAARVANNGALPPDLSVIAKARAGGPDYLYALLAGYADPPEDMELAEGMNYNKAFPGHQIAMAPPLFEEAVEYTDGTAPTLENHAKDVAAFLMWAAEPKLEERLKIGFRFMIYIVLLTAFLYIAKRRVWAGLKH
jgi:cytochrome c1